MEHVIDICAGRSARVEVTNIPFNKGETVPLLYSDEGADLVKVVLITRGEVVKSDDGLVQFQERFEKIGTDEARDDQ